MVTVSSRLVHRHLEEPAVKETFRFLEDDAEVQSYLRMANVMAVKRLNYNDHGPVHARIVTGSALEIFDLITEALEPSCVTNGVGDYENATMRRGNLVVRRERVPEKRSRTPQWSAFVDWTKGVLATIAPERVAEADDVLETSKKITPAHDEVVIETRETVVERA